MIKINGFVISVALFLISFVFIGWIVGSIFHDPDDAFIIRYKDLRMDFDSFKDSQPYTEQFVRVSKFIVQGVPLGNNHSNIDLTFLKTALGRSFRTRFSGNQRLTISFIDEHRCRIQPRANDDTYHLLIKLGIRLCEMGGGPVQVVSMSAGEVFHSLLHGKYRLDEHRFVPHGVIELGSSRNIFQASHRISEFLSLASKLVPELLPLMKKKWQSKFEAGLRWSPDYASKPCFQYEEGRVEVAAMSGGAVCPKFDEHTSDDRSSETPSQVNIKKFISSKTSNVNGNSEDNIMLTHRRGFKGVWTLPKRRMLEVDDETHERNENTDENANNSNSDEDNNSNHRNDDDDDDPEKDDKEDDPNGHEKNDDDGEVNSEDDDDWSFFFDQYCKFDSVDDHDDDDEHIRNNENLFSFSKNIQRFSEKNKNIQTSTSTTSPAISALLEKEKAILMDFLLLSEDASEWFRISKSRRTCGVIPGVDPVIDTSYLNIFVNHTRFNYQKITNENHNNNNNPSQSEKVEPFSDCNFCKIGDQFHSRMNVTYSHPHRPLHDLFFTSWRDLLPYDILTPGSKLDSLSSRIKQVIITGVPTPLLASRGGSPISTIVLQVGPGRNSLFYNREVEVVHDGRMWDVVTVSSLDESGHCILGLPYDASLGSFSDDVAMVIGIRGCDLLGLPFAMIPSLVDARIVPNMDIYFMDTGRHWPFQFGFFGDFMTNQPNYSNDCRMLQKAVAGDLSLSSFAVQMKRCNSKRLEALSLFASHYLRPCLTDESPEYDPILVPLWPNFYPEYASKSKLNATNELSTGWELKVYPQLGNAPLTMDDFFNSSLNLTECMQRRRSKWGLEKEMNSRATRQLNRQRIGGLSVKTRKKENNGSSSLDMKENKSNVYSVSQPHLIGEAFHYDKEDSSKDSKNEKNSHGNDEILPENDERRILSQIVEEHTVLTTEEKNLLRSLRLPPTFFSTPDVEDGDTLLRISDFQIPDKLKSITCTSQSRGLELKKSLDCTISKEDSAILKMETKFAFWTLSDRCVSTESAYYRDHGLKPNPNGLAKRY